MDASGTPYNTLNKVLSVDNLRKLLQGVELQPNDISLYRMALVHKSYCTRKNENFVDGNTNCPQGCLALQECSYERLEFLGDSVLSLVIASYLYERYPDGEEGFLTKVRTKLVNGEMLGHLSALIGLGDYLIISKQIEENNGRKNYKILEDVFESFVGAIFLDLGFESAYKFIINVIEENLDFAELIVSNNNFKDTFIKYFQQNFSYLPKFCDIRTTSKESVVCIKNKDNCVISTGKGLNKKAAEANAALNALKYYGQVA